MCVPICLCMHILWSFLFKFLFIKKPYVGILPTCVFLVCMYLVPLETVRGPPTPGAEAIDGCEPSDMGVRSLIHVLWKSIWYS